jgi:hypothetical protein
MADKNYADAEVIVAVPTHACVDSNSSNRNSQSNQERGLSRIPSKCSKVPSV